MKRKRPGVVSVPVARSLAAKLEAHGTAIIRACQQIREEGKADDDPIDVPDLELTSEEQTVHMEWQRVQKQQHVRLLTAITSFTKSSTGAFKKGTIGIRELRDRHAFLESLRAIVKPMFAERKESIQKATRGALEKGQKTRNRVLKLARGHLSKNPRLSKTDVAGLISDRRRPPCRYDQALKILNKEFTKRQWKLLGSTDR